MKENSKGYEILDATKGKLSSLNNSSKLLIGNVVDKIMEIPTITKDILKSFDKSEENYMELVKTDKNNIDLLIQKKLESENYSEEELLELLEKSEQITERSKSFFSKLSERRNEALLIVAGSMVAVLKIMIENKNRNS